MLYKEIKQLVTLNPESPKPKKFRLNHKLKQSTKKKKKKNKDLSDYDSPK